MKKGIIYLAIAGFMSVSSVSVFAASGLNDVPGPGDKKEKKKKKKKASKKKSCSYKGAKKSCCSKSAKAESNDKNQTLTPAK